MSTGVKQYNAGLDSSMIRARCDARWHGAAKIAAKKVGESGLLIS